MKTTMHEHKVTKTFKVAAASVLSLGVIGGSTLAFNVNDARTVSAGQIDSTSPAATASNSGGQDALIISAIETKLGEHAREIGVDYQQKQIYDIQNDGLNARARFGDGVAAAQSILHYEAPKTANAEGRWSVIFQGNGYPSQDLVDKYGLPQSWAENSDW